MRLENLSVRMKIMIIVLTALIGMGAVFAVAMNGLKTQMGQDRRAETQELVESAANVIGHFHAEMVAGRMTEADAKRAAIEAIRAMRYGSGGYFWINDMGSLMVMHPTQPQLEGKVLTDMKTASGDPLFVRMTQLVKDAGAGFYYYQWPKPGSEQAVDKVSYVRGFAPWGWVVGTGLYLDDLEQAFKQSALTDGALVVVVILVCLALSFWVARHLSGAVARISAAMGVLAHGDTSVEIPETQRRDELGEMALALGIFKENLIRVAALTEAQRQEHAEKEEQRRKVSQYFGEFELTVMSIVDGLSGAESMMRRAATEMGEGATHTKSLAVVVADAAQASAGNVATVASAAEELSASITEISQQVNRASDIAGRAVELSDGASSRIRHLEQTVGEIGRVVDLITSIAAQTNLLALNATIEAARAGDAGKGFAVVANEVKMLANQTAKATDEISAQISRVQQSTDETVAAISEIGQVIGEISVVTTSVSSAVEEQGAATQEIARSVEQASAGSHLVSSNIHEVLLAAERSAQIADDIVHNSQDLSEQTGLMRSNVDVFMERARAADMGSKDSLLTWSAALEVHDSLIDRQHQELIGTINELFAAINGGQNASVVAKAFNAMMDYTNRHLADEEQMMADRRFPEIEKHIKQHRGLVVRLREIYGKYEAGNAQAGDDLLNFLANWWTSHISTYDTRLASYAEALKLAA